MASARSNSVSDHNILFGMLALQMDLLSRDDLISALQKWMLDKSRRLDELLVETGVIDQTAQQVLLPLVELHVKQHEGDAKQSIAAIPAASEVIQELKSSEDSDVRASVALVSTGDHSGPYHAGYSQDTLIVKKPGRPSFDGQRFELIEKHAEGGIGRVSVARDLALNRDVAFKELKPVFAKNESARQRFVLEAEITGRLEHPGIVPVYASGRLDDDRPFYAMKFVRGTSLGDAIREYHESYNELSHRDQILRFHDLLRRFVSVCQTLDYAHARGVVHRDIKPANIMLGEFGETLVVDWGLAKAIGRAATDDVTHEATLHPEAEADVLATQDGSILGTLYYMSPEQAAGNIAEVDWLSDVYSLGATLYELLTGLPSVVAHQPKDQRSRVPMQEILRRVRDGDFPRPRSVVPRVPPALDAVCMRAMQRHKEDRYQSSHALAADIEAWLADEPISAWVEPLDQQAERVTSQVARGQVDLMIYLADAAEVAFRNGDERKAQYFYRHAQQINDTMHHTINLIAIRDRIRACLRLADVALRLRRADHARLYCKSALDAIAATRIGESTDLDAAVSEAECMVKLSVAYGLDGNSAKRDACGQNAFSLVETIARDHPLNLRVQTRLVDMCYQKAEDLCRKARHSEAQPLYERASDVLNRLIAAGIDVKNSQRRRQAIEPAIRKCIAMQPLPVVLSQPESNIPKLLSQRNIEQIELGQLASAVESAETLAHLTPETANNFYFAARSFERCIVELDEVQSGDTPVFSRAELIERALACLRQARQLGYEFPDDIAKNRTAPSDERFEVLHAYDAFWEITGSRPEGYSETIDKLTKEPATARSGITIIVSEFVNSPDTSLAYNAQQSMRHLIDDVYWLLQGTVPKHSYGETWVLSNDSTGEEYRDVDAYVNKLSPANCETNRQGERRYVKCTVSRVGIEAGAVLRAKKLAVADGL
jgi:serine/threonine protein kinase